jgi:hypothetical protein
MARGIEDTLARPPGDDRKGLLPEGTEAAGDRRRHLPPRSLHPDRSFSATATDVTTDVAGQLERLGALRAEGVLSEEEFRAAKARVLGTIAPPTSG